MTEITCNVLIYGGIAGAIIFAGVAVIIFIKLDIPKVVGDLTGSNARKKIREIQEKGYESVASGGATKKDAIKSRPSSSATTGKISIREVGGSPRPNVELTKKGDEKYKQALAEIENLTIASELDEYEQDTDLLIEDNAEEQTAVLGSDPYGDPYDQTEALQDDELFDEPYEQTEVLQDEGTYVMEGAYDSFTDEETELLRGYDVADEEATDVLRNYDVADDEEDDDATDVLKAKDAYYEEDEGSSTEELRSSDAIIKPSIEMVKLVDIVVVHTDETV